MTVLRSRASLEIEGNPGRASARHAKHHPVARALFVIGEEDVAVVRHAFQHAREASAANALLARRRHEGSILRQHLGNSPVVRNCVVRTSARDRNLKGLTWLTQGSRVSGEVFEMDGLGLPGRGSRGLDQIHEGLWPA